MKERTYPSNETMSDSAYVEVTKVRTALNRLRGLATLLERHSVLRTFTISTSINADVSVRKLVQ